MNIKKRSKVPNSVYDELQECFKKCLPRTSIQERIIAAKSINPKGSHKTLYNYIKPY